ncbi:MAG: OmpA family protein [Magnetococcales bacterium]|nr:OmpA family protein [Magnetococcales bacterium]MBF0438859.1 OmpA family protein [Magnetococcales bacterium]
MQPFKTFKLAILLPVGLLSLSLAGCVTPSSTDKEGWPGQNGFIQWHPQTGKNMVSSVGTQCYFCSPVNKAEPPVAAAKPAIDGDADQDGVVDSKDQCPNTPMGVKVDAKGCPVDSDKDGVTDDKDKCPNTPAGAKVNNLGCWVLEDLHFKTNKDQIEPVSFPLLDSVVTVLKNNPSLRVEIQGHTDSTGTVAKNDKLSKSRAHSVMKYLTSHGIAANRLTTAGYGSSKPIAPNNTPDGRAKNRRVELKPQS